MKKTFRFIPFILVLLLLSYGCATTDEARRDANTRSGVRQSGDEFNLIDGNGTYNGRTRNGVYDFSGDTYGDTPEGDTALNDYNNRTRSPETQNQEDRLGDRDTIDMIEDLCTRRDNVEDATVVINDDTCYVGLDLEEGRNISENMKEELSTEIKRGEPNIRKVYFTDDRNAIDEFINSISNTVDINWDELNNLFRR